MTSGTEFQLSCNKCDTLVNFVNSYDANAVIQPHPGLDRAYACFCEKCSSSKRAELIHNYAKNSDAALATAIFHLKMMFKLSSFSVVKAIYPFFDAHAHSFCPPYAADKTAFKKSIQSTLARKKSAFDYTEFAGSKYFGFKNEVEPVTEATAQVRIDALGSRRTKDNKHEHEVITNGLKYETKNWIDELALRQLGYGKLLGIAAGQDPVQKAKRKLEEISSETNKRPKPEPVDVNHAISNVTPAPQLMALLAPQTPLDLPAVTPLPTAARSGNFGNVPSPLFSPARGSASVKSHKPRIVLAEMSSQTDELPPPVVTDTDILNSIVHIDMSSQTDDLSLSDVDEEEETSPRLSLVDTFSQTDDLALSILDGAVDDDDIDMNSTDDDKAQNLEEEANLLPGFSLPTRTQRETEFREMELRMTTFEQKISRMEKKTKRLSRENKDLRRISEANTNERKVMQSLREQDQKISKLVNVVQDMRRSIDDKPMCSIL